MVPTDSAPIIGSLGQFSEQPSLVDRRRELVDLLGLSDGPTHAIGSSGAWPVRTLGRYLDLPLDDWAEAS